MSNRVTYRETRRNPPPADPLEQYRYHLKTWCVYKRRARKGQGWDGWERAVVVDEEHATAVIEIAEADLGEAAADELWTWFRWYTDKRHRKGGKGYEGKRLPPDAWSMYYPRCVLCRTTDVRHYRGGRCRSCYQARWDKRHHARRIAWSIRTNGENV